MERGSRYRNNYIIEDSKEGNNDNEKLNDETKIEKQRKTGGTERKKLYTYIYIYSNPLARAGYDTRSIFKQILTVFKFSFPFP